jgi:pullulanase/glycogen debranching enzyme
MKSRTESSWYNTSILRGNNLWATPLPIGEPSETDMINDLWYKNAVIYSLAVETFMDANGDGVGDFQGLMRRLDYLAGLGITAIWLMPFQTSPGLTRDLRPIGAT